MGIYCKDFALFGILLLCLGEGSALEINHVDKGKMNYASRATADDVHFYLWTNSNSEDDQYFELINGDSGRLEASPFDGSKKTYFITHGYNSDGLTSFITEGKTKILSLELCNVISIDWEKLAFSVDYFLSANQVYEVGPFVATFIDWLATETGLETSNIQMTGHSLGAHVIGMAAQSVTSGQIDRLTGLDPAGPAFYNSPATERLDKSQANYVDIIHSNGGSIETTHFGLITAVGHTDFFPNGGKKQSGCSVAQDAVGCSHDRVHDLWVESITAGPDYENGDGSTSLTFQSWPCASWDEFDAGNCPDCGAGCLNLGFHNNNGLEGLFYLSTYESAPYAFGVAQ